MQKENTDFFNLIEGIFGVPSGDFDRVMRDFENNFKRAAQVTNRVVVRDDVVLVEFEAPGFNESDLHLSKTTDKFGKTWLVLKATADDNFGDRSKLRRLHKIAQVPKDATTEGSTAKLRDGILRVTLPREVTSSSETINITRED